MSRIRFLWDNKLDIATLTPSSEVSSLPAKNIQHPHRKLVWRTTSKWLQWVQANFTEAQTIKAVALINHNFYNVGCVMRLLGSSFAQVGGSIYGEVGRLWDWMFKDGTDRSAAGMILTPHGTVGTPTICWNGDAGGFGFSCLFDRTDIQYWDHADDDALDVGTEDFTLMGWIKNNYTAACQEIIHKMQTDPSAIGYLWGLEPSQSNKQSLNLYNTSGNVIIYSNTGVIDNTWHHIAVAVNRTTNEARFYLDGSPDSDWQDISAIGAATLSNTQLFCLGGSVLNLYNGYMGPMMLIKQKLTDGQIAINAAQPAIKEDLTYNSEIIIKNFTGGSYRYWRLEFANNDNPINYIDIGRMFLGNYFEPSRQFARGWEEMLIDPSRVEQSEQGQEWVDLKEKHRLIRVEFPEGAPLSDADRESYREMLKEVGCSKDLFIALDYDNDPNKLSLYGKFAQTEFNFREFLNGLFSTGFDFKESR